MASELPGFDEFPVSVAAWCRDVRRAGRSLAVESFRAAAPIEPRMLVLPRVRVSWRLYLAVVSQKVTFFFRRVEQHLLRLDARVSFEIAHALPRTSAAAPPVFRLAVPGVLVHPVHADRLAAMTSGDPRATRARSVVIDLGGGDELVVLDAARGPAVARMYLNTVAAAGTASVEPTVGLMVRLIERLAEWTAGEVRDHGPRVLSLNAPSGPSSAVRQILIALGESYRLGSEALRDPSHGIERDPFVHGYGLSELHARIVLRLNPRTLHLASDPGSDHFQIGLTVRIEPSGPGETPEAQVSLGVPDFLVGGPMHDAFLDALRRETRAGFGAIAAGVRDFGLLTDAAEVDAFFSRGLERLAIFRVRRVARDDEPDVDILTTTGRLGGRRIRLIVEAPFRVNTSTGARHPVELAGPLGVLFCGDPAGSVAPSPPRLVAHLLRLIAAIGQWQQGVA